MKIKILHECVVDTTGKIGRVGEILDLPETTAADLVRYDRAEILAPDKVEKWAEDILAQSQPDPEARIAAQFLKQKVLCIRSGRS